MDTHDFSVQVYAEVFRKSVKYFVEYSISRTQPGFKIDGVLNYEGVFLEQALTVDGMVVHRLLMAEQSLYYPICLWLVAERPDPYVVEVVGYALN